ncbi:GILT-like protein F37H8.5 [Trichinella sp. T6]|nr:GILT-like protein F37H8.5 [Trichinella sp. T6]
MAEITENVKPHPHYFVPWILINDLSTAQLQIYQNGLFNFLCDWHRGSVPKGCAEFTNLFKQRKNFQSPASYLAFLTVYILQKFWRDVPIEFCSIDFTIATERKGTD